MEVAAPNSNVPMKQEPIESSAEEAYLFFSDQDKAKEFSEILTIVIDSCQ